MLIRILIADDHEIVRTGMRHLVAGTGIEVVAEAATGRDAHAAVRSSRPDVAVLDVRFPDEDGLATLGRIKLDHPSLPVLMLSMYDHPAYVARAMALGAEGYLLKTVDRAKLVAAIHRLAQGESLWQLSDNRRLVGALSAARLRNDVDVPLTEREACVLRSCCEGKTNKEIAVELKIRPDTVKEHVQHILKKVGVSDRTQAAIWAAQKGIL